MMEALVVSSITNGIFGGGKGLDFQAKSADIQTPTTVAQAQEQYGNVQNALAQQQALLNQYQQLASGQGPNPALAQLNNTTGQNIQQQAALMASQRGAAANPALLARLAAQQGANIQQQALGQGAALQAQQQLGALQAQQGAVQGLSNTSLAGQQNILQGIQSQNQAMLGNTQQQNQANASIAGHAAQLQGDIFKGVTGAAGKAIMGAFAEGGVVENIAPQQDPIQEFNAYGSIVGANINPNAQPVPMSGPRSAIAQYLAKGGPVKAMVSPGETYLDPNAVNQVQKGANPLDVGQKIPGTPKVQGNSYKNDTVPATLQEGGIVIPNSIMQSKDPSKKAAEFVAAVLKRQSLKK